MPLTFYRGPDYLALPREPQPWLIEPLIPIGGLVNIYGKPKTGKSYAAIGMALAVANGDRTWNGFKVHKQGPVAYLQVDTPRGDWAGRFLKLEGAGFNLFNIFIADMHTVPYPYNILDPKHFNELRDVLRSINPVLVVVDTLRESFAGNENDSDVMRGVISNFVAASMPSAVMFVSHARKDGVMTVHQAEDDLMDDSRGSSYLPGRMDVIIKMTKRRFIYKGRGSGGGAVDIEQDKELQLIHLADQTQKFDWQTQARELLNSDPTLSQNKVAQIINGGERTGQFNSIKRAIADVFKAAAGTGSEAQAA